MSSSARQAAMEKAARRAPLLADWLAYCDLIEICQSRRKAADGSLPPDDAARYAESELLTIHRRWKTQGRR